MPARGGSSTTTRRVQIKEEKDFPWLLVGLGFLTLIAVGVVLYYSGFIRF